MKTDFIDAGADFSEELAHWLSEDPFFQPTAGHPIVSMFQDEKQEKAAQLLRSNDLPVNIWGRYELNEMEDIVDFFQEMINSLSAGRKAALPNMAWPVGGQFVMTLMYLSGKVSANEWAEAIFSRTEDVCRIIGDQPVAWNMSMSCDLSEEERAELIASIISGYESSCAIVDAFLVSIGEH